jgi:hypothetical protein
VLGHQVGQRDCITVLLQRNLQQRQCGIAGAATAGAATAGLFCRWLSLSMASVTASLFSSSATCRIDSRAQQQEQQQQLDCGVSGWL